MLKAVGAVKLPKSREVLAERLRAEILHGSLPAGTRLPTERELATSTGLSRTSIREALRILEAEGLVHTRLGRYGNSIATRPSDAALGRYISLFAKGNNVSLQSLVEVRSALEPMVAQLAAANRTEEDIAKLREISGHLEKAAEEHVPEFPEWNARWHDALAAASHNELLRAFMSSIAGLMIEVSQIKFFSSTEIRLLVCRTHRKILEAVVSQDSEAARRRAERDVAAYARYLEAAVA